MTALGWAVATALGAFTLRRMIFWAASLVPARRVMPSVSRSVVLLVTARNEANKLPRLLAALAALDYPASRLDIILISDGSSDATPAIINRWAEARPRVRAMILPDPQGKGAALQTGWLAAPASELVAVVDADTVPRPDALAWLAGAFDIPDVGAAGGYPDPGVDQTAIVSRYAALERWVTHLVTLAAKDRLDLRPAVMGALGCFRSEALARAGGFPRGSLAEDVGLSMAIARDGWKTRWVRQAVVREDAPSDFGAFRQQRLRWSRGLMSSSARANGLEDLFVAAGYLDRVAFGAAVILTFLGRLPAWCLAVFAAAPLAIMTTALWRANPPNKLAYLWSAAPMAFVDVALTLESVAGQVLGTRLSWRARARPTLDGPAIP